MKILDGLAMDYRGVNKDDTLRKKIEANVATNIERGLPAADFSRRVGQPPIAIVGYGPSLAQTWERLRDFAGEIVTVSKAHDYLVERGIQPRYHVDVDVSVSKMYCITKPQAGTTYLMATKMVPDVLDGLKDHTVELFHVPIWGDEDADPRYPRAKLLFDATQTASDIFFQRGHYAQHWFGVDYGMSGGKTYPGEHPGTAHEAMPLDLGGERHTTSTIMVSGLLMAEHLFHTRPMMNVTIHGDGLLGTYLTKRRRVNVAVK